jgi:hypothetical protein
MPNATKDGLINHVGADGQVSAEDVIYLRRNVFADGVVSREELSVLFSLGRRAPSGDPEWADYFAEAAADFFLREEEPQGYLTDEEFQHLASIVGRNGSTMLELGLLVALMEKAVSTPPAMAAFVADEFRRAVAAHKGGPRVTRADADLLRRYLYAAGGDGSIAITRNEAEMLFDVHDMTAGADNDPAWADIFVKAIGAHLMALVRYGRISREHAISLHTPDPADGPAYAAPTLQGEKPVDRAKTRAKDMLDNILSPKKAHADRVERRAREVNERREKEIAAAEAVTSEEGDWLAERIGRNGHFDDVERSLLSYMRDLDAELPPKLAALVEKAA